MLASVVQGDADTCRIRAGTAGPVRTG